jgi:acetaldehyde dehydrogenase (acetylating)
MTLGPGTFGKSIISENVSAKHLINIKRLAFETRPINQGETLETGQAVGSRQKSVASSQNVESASPGKTHSWMEEIEERIRLKAGNQPVRPKPHAEEKPHAEATKEAQYGSGMTVDQVEKVMREFKK